MLLRTVELRNYALPDEQQGAPTLVPAIASAGAATFIVGKHGVDLADLLPELLPEHTYPLLSKGQWSLHEMLAYLLSITGPAAVSISSWGITSEPLKAVIRLQELGLITGLECLFDSRVKLQCPEAYQIALVANARVRLAKNHSKMLVILNEQYSVMVNTSANLTMNPRIESYVIMTHRAAVEQYASVFREIMDGANPFDRS